MDNRPTPTIDQLADAIDYVRLEFNLEANDNRIDGEMWAEGLAFSREGQAGSDSYRSAREALPQLTTVQWTSLAARAQHMRLCNGYAFFDMKIETA